MFLVPYVRIAISGAVDDLESFAYLGWRCIMYRCSEERVNYVTGIGGLMVPETPRWLDSVKLTS